MKAYPGNENTYFDEKNFETHEYETEIRIIDNPRNYPGLLQHIHNPPKKLYIRGKLNENTTHYITIIGSRKCTHYGKEVVEMILAELEPYRQNLSIVSGLAYGIDVHAHRVALDYNMHCIVVPGSGINNDVIYPTGNKKLGLKIIESGGAMISYFKPSQVAAPWTFPARNRIMAGISHATIVIEAQEKSGSLITARFAMEENRDVITIPGMITKTSSTGTNKLISDGAHCLWDVSELPELLDLKPSSSKNNKTASKSEKTNLSRNLFTKPALIIPEKNKAVYDLLEKPLSASNISQKLGKDISEISIQLTEMEMDGHIRNEFGKYVQK